MMTDAQEREFLIRLAPIWLACRWRIMGGSLEEPWWPKPDLANDIRGELDYAFEMRLLCAEVLQCKGITNAKI